MDSGILRYIILVIMILMSAGLTGCGAGDINVSGNMSSDEGNVVDIQTDISNELTDDNIIADDNKDTDGEEDTDNSEETDNEEDTDDSKGTDSEEDADNNIEDNNAYEKLKTMTLEEKVAQMFIVIPESIAPGMTGVEIDKDKTKEVIDKIPVGGVIYLPEDIRDPEQVRTTLANFKESSIERIGLPMFLCVDEEGGRIARIADNKMFGVDNVGSMMDIGAKGDADIAYITGNYMGAYLTELGFNLDFAPVVDVESESYNSALYMRTFSDDPDAVSRLANALSKGLESKGVISVYKHFPGHGSTTGDPHKGYTFTDKTLEELKMCDLIPYEKGIDEDISMIMVGHITLPNVVEDGLPASLSEKIITDMLREDMGYQGVVVTDAMNMGAIKDVYESDEATIMAVEAGADIVLMPKEFDKAYNGLLNAVNNGDVSESRIDDSVLRILKLKYRFFSDDIN